LTSALDVDELHVAAALSPEKQTPVPTGYEAGWAAEPVWKLWSREESLASVVNRTPALQPVARRYTDRAIRYFAVLYEVDSLLKLSTLIVTLFTFLGEVPCYITSQISQFRVKMGHYLRNRADPSRDGLTVM
jgi:hypothetical protein